MPDLVPNHSVANVNSPKTTTTTAVMHRQILHDPQASIGSDDTNNYGGHQIHHLINSSISTGPHPVAHLSHMNVSSQHSSAILFDQVQGTKLKGITIIDNEDIIYI